MGLLITWRIRDGADRAVFPTVPVAFRFRTRPSSWPRLSPRCGTTDDDARFQPRWAGGSHLRGVGRLFPPGYAKISEGNGTERLNGNLSPGTFR